jgi:hypothetical protein
MDRKKAQSLIGKRIKLDNGDAGSYIAMLKDIIAEPRKPWRGVVEILALIELPAFEKTTNQLQQPQYKKNQVIECDGGKLSPLPEQQNIPDYNNSIIQAAEKRLETLQIELHSYQEKEEALHSYLKDLGVDLQDNRTNSIVYTFHHDGDRYILVDEKDERLDLEDCPFKISWKIKDQNFTGSYETNGSFLSDSGTRYTPKEGSVFTISKEQFDPYVILRNELEPAALTSLEKNLNFHNLNHENLIDCHNTLLTQLLKSDGQKTFKGVNFLTYKRSEEMVLVQHHYERELHHFQNDKVYDRFEFTTDQGKRSIVTYTNEYSM